MSNVTQLDLYRAASAILEDPSAFDDEPKPRVRVEPIAARINLVHLTDAIALAVKLLKRAGKGGRRARTQCAYFGFNDNAAANCLAQELNETYGAFCTVRRSKHLTGWTWELKVCADDSDLEAIATRYHGHDFQQWTEQDVAQAELEEELEEQAECRAEEDKAPCPPTPIRCPRKVPPQLKGIGLSWHKQHYAKVYQMEVPPQGIGKIIRVGHQWRWENPRGAVSSYLLRTWQDAVIDLRNNQRAPRGISIA